MDPLSKSCTRGDAFGTLTKEHNEYAIMVDNELDKTFWLHIVAIARNPKYNRESAYYAHAKIW